MISADEDLAAERCPSGNMRCNDIDMGDEELLVGLLQLDLNLGSNSTHIDVHASQPEQQAKMVTVEKSKPEMPFASLVAEQPSPRLVGKKPSVEQRQLEQDILLTVVEMASKQNASTNVEAAPLTVTPRRTRARPAFASLSKLRAVLERTMFGVPRSGLVGMTSETSAEQLIALSSSAAVKARLRPAYASHSNLRERLYQATQESGGGLALGMCALVAIAILGAVWLQLPEDPADNKGMFRPPPQQQARYHPFSRTNTPQSTAPSLSGGGGAAQSALMSGHFNPAGSLLPMPSTSSRSREFQGSSLPVNAFATTSRGRDLPGPPGPASMPPAIGAGVKLGLGNVPEICTSLVLPTQQARFVIKLDQMMRLEHPGQLDIKGTSGRTLLHVSTGDTETGGRKLSLASVGCESDPRTIVEAPVQPGEAFQVYGKFRDFYGTLESVPGGTGSLLKYKGQPVMTIEMGDSADLKMLAYAMDGTLLGTAGRQADCALGPEVVDGWKLAVPPGADSVLISSCMLSMVLLRGTNPADRLSALPGAAYGQPGVIRQYPGARPSLGLAAARSGSLPMPNMRPNY